MVWYFQIIIAIVRFLNQHIFIRATLFGFKNYSVSPTRQATLCIIQIFVLFKFVSWSKLNFTFLETPTYSSYFMFKSKLIIKKQYFIHILFHGMCNCSYNSIYPIIKISQPNYTIKPILFLFNFLNSFHSILSLARVLSF